MVAKVESHVEHIVAVMRGESRFKVKEKVGVYFRDKIRSGDCEGTVAKVLPGRRLEIETAWGCIVCDERHVESRVHRV